MLKKSAWVQYLLLAVVVVSMLVFYVHGATAVLENALYGDRIARLPVDFAATLDIVDVLRPEAEAAGVHKGDRLVSVNGQRFAGFRVLLAAVRQAHPGDRMQLGLEAPDGQTRTAAVRLAPLSTEPHSRLYFFTVDILHHLLFPLFCILCGGWVVLAKPRDHNAWLLLGVFCFFPTNLLSGTFWADPVSLYVARSAGSIANALGPLWVFLFGVYFPQSSPFNLRRPWLKWLLIVPMACFCVYSIFVNLAWMVDLQLAVPFFKHDHLYSQIFNVLAIACFSFFFALLLKKVQSTADPDGRRRLSVLYWGSTIGCTPLCLVVLIQFVRGTEFSDTVPQWLLLIVFAMFAIFPLTLTYVVVVQRAMDVRLLVRQGTKYAFARQSVYILRFLIGVWIAWSMRKLSQHPAVQQISDELQLAIAVGLLFLFRGVLSVRLQKIIDQRFFREAYSTEQVLSELSEEARNFTETGPLLNTVTERIGQTLHVERIAVFLRVGESFQLHSTTGVAPLAGGKIISLPAASTTITTLTRSKTPANVYPGDSSSWLVDATDAERAALADLSTELLVPLPGRNRLAGVIALGPKRSEEPYSKIDRQLLQTVASQTGMALENAELLDHLTTEIAERERVSRDLEIAREVQERLFPQHYPKVAGVDMAGFCRPAQAVGGDYYDFFSLDAEHGKAARLAIAIGDISGKGIPAALLMASLRASLRSVAMMQPESLAVLIQHVNRLVFEASTSNRYATFFYAEYAPATRLLAYVNAGHNSPYVLRAGEVMPLEVTGTVVGLLADAEYAQATLQLQPGDVLLAFTDGISEAMTHDDEEWGEERMVACAQKRIEDTGCAGFAKQLLECVLKAADGFTQGAPQHDDMTLVVCVMS